MEWIKDGEQKASRPRKNRVVHREKTAKGGLFEGENGVSRLFLRNLIIKSALVRKKVNSSKRVRKRRFRLKKKLIIMRKKKVYARRGVRFLLLKVEEVGNFRKTKRN